MNIHELKYKFESTKKYAPNDVNELLDFVKRCYICQDIPTSDYRKLINELETQGATVPDETIELDRKLLNK